MRLRICLAVGCLALEVSSRALAQSEPEVSAPPAAPVGAEPARPRGAEDRPDLPEITDQMLEPVPPPARVLKSWQEALELVRTRNTSLATARAQVLTAQAQARLALAQSLPSLVANGVVQRSLLFGRGIGRTADRFIPNARQPQQATIWSAGLSFRQRLLDVQSWYDQDTASLAVDANLALVQDTQRVAMGALADTLVTVITAGRLTDVSRVSLRSNLSTLDLTRRRARLGAASAVDVLRSEQEVVSNRADVVQADEGLRRAREALGMALGFPMPWGISPDIQIDQLAADARAVCSPVDSTDDRSDVRAARAQLAVSERAVKSVDLGYSPTLDLTSDYNYNTSIGLARPSSWQVGAVLTVPLYDGGATAATRVSAHAQAEASIQRLTETQRRAQLEATQSQRAITVARANFEVSQKARDIARESARLARIAFVHGTGTSFDLVESARRMRLAEIDLTIKEFEVIRAEITALLALSNCTL